MARLLTAALALALLACVATASGRPGDVKALKIDVLVSFILFAAI